MSDTILDNLSPAEVLGLTIIGEARGERIEGQVAVGSVIRNRMTNNPAKYHSLTTVCLEPWQFSCWNKNDPNRVILLEIAEKLVTGQILNSRHHVQCMFVARGIESWAIMDNTNGALNYMTSSLFNGDNKPSWAKNAKNEKVIDHHTFFNA